MRSVDKDVTLNVTAPDGLAAELTRQPGRCLVHLVNYRGEQPARIVAHNLENPVGFYRQCHHPDCRWRAGPGSLTGEKIEGHL